jgi:inosine-uridine nucleoside N-ribohydrolase
LHALVSRSEANLLAVTITKDNPLVGPAIDALNTFYGRPDIPIGMVKGGKTPESNPLLTAIVNHYPHKLQSGNDAPGAVAVLRRVLSAQPDASVTLVQVGFSTNLARLYAQDPDLVKRKVKRLVAMAGNFRNGPAEYNVKTDIPSAQQVFRDWPSEIIASGFEVGEALLYPARSIEHDFSYVPHHPVADAYRAYEKMPYNRPTWDLTAALYAVRSDEGYFSLSAPGTISVDPQGKTQFTPSANGKHRYLIVDDGQRARIIEAFRELVSQPPSKP